jgi:hypothetical protein
MRIVTFTAIKDFILNHANADKALRERYKRPVKVIGLVSQI